jgi:multiple antibiotic resistance protein
MKQHLQAIVTVLSLVNPLICGAMFAQIEAGQDRAMRLADATKVALSILLILSVAALAGAKVLQIFGISLQAFSVAGGGVLIWIGCSLLRGHSVNVDRSTKVDTTGTRSLTPVILFAASPGTITGVITLAVAHAKLALPVTALVAVAIAALVTWIVMVFLTRGGSGPRSGSLRQTVAQFMGLIVIAMGVQFTLTGLHDFFAALPNQG